MAHRSHFEALFVREWARRIGNWPDHVPTRADYLGDRFRDSLANEPLIVNAIVGERMKLTIEYLFLISDIILFMFLT